MRCALSEVGGGVNTGVLVADHAASVRYEAARKLAYNFSFVVDDVVNASADTNIVGKPLTQRELRRVDSKHRKYVEQFLREVISRLIEEQCDLDDDTNKMAWVDTYNYLDRRLHTPGMEPADRTPDMGVEAASVLRLMLRQVAGMQSLRETLRLEAISADGAEQPRFDRQPYSSATNVDPSAPRRAAPRTETVSPPPGSTPPDSTLQSPNSRSWWSLLAGNFSQAPTRGLRRGSRPGSAHTGSSARGTAFGRSERSDA